MYPMIAQLQRFPFLRQCSYCSVSQYYVFPLTLPPLEPRHTADPKLEALILGLIPYKNHWKMNKFGLLGLLGFQEGLKMAQDGPKTAPTTAQDGPMSAHEAPKTAPEGPKRTPRRPQDTSKTAKTAQGGPRRAPKERPKRGTPN